MSLCSYLSALEKKRIILLSYLQSLYQTASIPQSVQLRLLEGGGQRKWQGQMLLFRQTSTPTIVVTINYRLGFFGFSGILSINLYKTTNVV
jgi:hypothetical protein